MLRAACQSPLPAASSREFGRWWLWWQCVLASNVLGSRHVAVSLKYASNIAA